MGMTRIFLLLRLSLFFTRTILFFSNSHPLSAALLLVIATLGGGIRLNRYLRIWFFFALMLIFLGGIIVIFLYITTLSRNDKIKSSLFLEFATTFFGVIIVRINLRLVSRDKMFTLSGLYEESSGLMLLFLTFYLLITLLVVVKLRERFKGTLRTKV